MKTLTAAATTATQRKWAAPRYLLEFVFSAPSALTLRVSDAYRNEVGQEWLGFVRDFGELAEAPDVLVRQVHVSLLVALPLDELAARFGVVERPLRYSALNARFAACCCADLRDADCIPIVLLFLL